MGMNKGNDCAIGECGLLLIDITKQSGYCGHMKHPLRPDKFVFAWGYETNMYQTPSFAFGIFFFRAG
jgi:hypothetical protein